MFVCLVLKGFYPIRRRAGLSISIRATTIVAKRWGKEVGMNKIIFLAIISIGLSFEINTYAANELKTNALYMADAPKWVTANRLDRVVNHIQSKMEWSIRRINVYWYADEDSYAKVNKLGPIAIAFAKRSDSTIHLGPRIVDKNFDQVFGHELVHVISHQKYKEAIPKWIEEGLANHLSKNGKVDYKWLAAQSMPADLRSLIHPYNGSTDQIRYHYLASQALTEMIASKCDLLNLLRMSVGRKLDNYLANLCGINDLNADFKKWLAKHN